MWLRYVGPRYGGGVVEDFEHEKFYWGPENNWECDVPDRLAGMVIQSKGTEMFLPSLPPGTQVAQGTTDEQKQKEEELLELEIKIDNKDEELLTRSIAVEDREAAVGEREKSVGIRDKAVRDGITEVENRKTAVKAREEAVDVREKATEVLEADLKAREKDIKKKSKKG